MRFGVPRSESPSPVRGSHRSSRGASTFGLYSDDDSDDYESAADSDLDAQLYSSDSDSDSSSPDRRSELKLQDLSPPSRPLPRSPHAKLSEEEARLREATVAAIRLHTRHHDPLEEWEKKTRHDAFRYARKEQRHMHESLYEARDKARSADLDRLIAQHTRQMEDVQSQLSALRIKHQADEERLKTAWKARETKLWERIEGVIKFEEEKVRKRKAEEDRIREEAERTKRDEKQKEEEAEAARLAKEAKLKSELLAAQQRKDQEVIRRKQQEEREMETAENRKRLGITTALDDWAHGRNVLRQLKRGPMAFVKSDKDLKAKWSTLRRKITPKIGQLTNDSAAIRRITQQVVDIVQPSPPHSESLYHALLSALAKAILLQAETEVTAHKESAIPLSIVTTNLLQRLPYFPEVLWAKLVQRAGGWPVPVAVPEDKDSNGEPWASPEERRKAMGYREGETESECATRVAGIMRVFFLILWSPLEGEQTMEKLFQTSRFWTWFSRLLGREGSRLLRDAAGAEIAHVALEVGGIPARAAWGKQWDKVLKVIEVGLRDGLDSGEQGRTVIGGDSPDGKAAKVRVELDVQNLLS